MRGGRPGRPARARSCWKALIAVFLAACVAGCASARMEDRETSSLFRAGQYDQAASRLRRGLANQGESGRDSLLYLLDLGLALHSGGRYADSNKVFLKANDIAEIKDYTSLSTEGATLLVSDNIKDYKGEDFEKVLINTYLAMNYALLGDIENALVEARRVNQKLYRMVSEGKRRYKQNAFARYLSAILYESEGDWNDAYVDYQNTLDLAPGLPGLGGDLWRMAWLLHMDDGMRRWDRRFHLTKRDHAAARELSPGTGKGEVIVLYENGISPVKRPNPDFESIPRFYPRYNPVQEATVEVNGEPRGQTLELMNIEQVAMENLDEKYAGIIAKKAAGLVAKGAVGYGVARATHSALLGVLTGMVLNDLDQADCRSWNLLPRDLQMLRVPLDPGAYSVRVVPVGAGPLPAKSVIVRPGEKVFVDFRYMP